MRGQKIEQIERPQSLSDIAAEAIRDAIITGQYALGEALSENSLTEALGTSKTPIREALALLKHEGLVTVVPQKGTFVFTMSVDEVAQLASYRFALESQAIGYSMARDQDALVSSLLDIADRMSVAHTNSRTARYLALDGEYHNALFENCGNQYLADGYQAIAGKIAALRTHLSRHPTHTDKSMREHVEMAKLLKAGDVKKAKALLKRHVTRGERTYADGVEDIATASVENRRIKRSSRK